MGLQSQAERLKFFPLTQAETLLNCQRAASAGLEPLFSVLIQAQEARPKPTIRAK